MNKLRIDLFKTDLGTLVCKFFLPIDKEKSLKTGVPTPEYTLGGLGKVYLHGLRADYDEIASFGMYTLLNTPDTIDQERIDLYFKAGTPKARALAIAGVVTNELVKPEYIIMEDSNEH